jgi:hypothetical protein
LGTEHSVQTNCVASSAPKHHQIESMALPTSVLGCKYMLVSKRL